MGLFAVGVTGTIGNALFDYTYVGIGPTAGISLPLPRWARVDLLATVGAHSYMHAGKGLLTSDPGADGTLPFVGARAHLGVEFGGRELRLGFGLRPYFEADLGRIQRTYSYDESVFKAHRETVTHTIGTQRVGAALAIVGTFGL